MPMLSEWQLKLVYSEMDILIADLVAIRETLRKEYGFDESSKASEEGVLGRGCRRDEE
jgi:hypothetical protein